MRRARPFGMLVILGVAAGCGRTSNANDVDSGAASSADTSSSLMRESQPDSLAIDLTAPAEAHAGTAITFTVRVQNRTTRPIDLYLRGREPTFDLIVSRATGDTVWHRLEGEVIPAIVNLRPVPPGDSLVLSATWDQRGTDGSTVAPGDYVARGSLLTETGALQSAPARFRITPR